MTERDRRMFVKQAAGMAAAVALVPRLGVAVPRLRAGAPLPVGVIGVGRQGRAIIGELQKIEAVSIAALCDSDAGRLSAGVKRATGADGFADHRELLDKRKDVSAVFIATPTHLHTSIVKDCLAAGRHVYCEAPIAHSIDECREIVGAARGAKTAFYSGLHARANPVYALARTFFRSDAVRDLVAMRAHHYQKTAWRTPATDAARDRFLNWQLDPEVSIGMAGELGTQQFDVFMHYTGRFPTRVSGNGSIRLHNDGRKIADTVACTMAFDGGANLAYEATLANSYEGRYEVLYGTNAAIKLAWSHGWMFKEADAPTQGWEVYANRQKFFNDEGITLIADATKLASQGKLKDGVGLPFPPLYYAVGDFLRSVVDGKTVGCTAEDGFRATVVGILANQSVVKGEPVAIDQALLKGA